MSAVDRSRFRSRRPLDRPAGPGPVGTALAAWQSRQGLAPGVARRRRRRQALGRGALVIASSLVATAALADPSYDVRVWTGVNSRGGAAAMEQADAANPLASTPPDAEFTYTGVLDWVVPARGTNTLSQFVASGRGSVTRCVGVDCQSGTELRPGVLLSSSGFHTTTLMELVFDTNGPWQGTVTHDDGASLTNVTDTVAYLFKPAPTAAQTAAFSLPGAGRYRLWYVEANGAPSVLALRLTGSGSTRPPGGVVPAPGLAGVLGMGFLGLWRRRRAAPAGQVRQRRRRYDRYRAVLPATR